MMLLIFKILAFDVVIKKEEPPQMLGQLRTFMMAFVLGSMSLMILPVVHSLYGMSYGEPGYSQLNLDYIEMLFIYILSALMSFQLMMSIKIKYKGDDDDA